jgi:hypothetical protein
MKRSNASYNFNKQIGSTFREAITEHRRRSTPGKKLVSNPPVQPSNFSSNYLKHYLSMVSGVSGQLAQRAELDELDSKV